MTEVSAGISRDIIAGLRKIGYLGPLLEENYAFLDWFTPLREERRWSLRPLDRRQLPTNRRA